MQVDVEMYKGERQLYYGSFALSVLIRDALRAHGSELSGLSRREALKWLERGGTNPRALSRNG